MPQKAYLQKYLKNNATLYCIVHIKTHIFVL